MRAQRAIPHAIISICSLALLLACSGSGTASVTGGMGRLDIQLTDAPIDLSGVKSVEVSIAGVLVYPGVEGMDDETAPPIVLMQYPQTFDLLTLTGGATTLLASGEVPAGFYQRIRLEVSSASLTYLDDTTADLKIESNKVDVPIPFQVEPGNDTMLVLDFDAATSVQVNETGSNQFILRPVVTPKQP